MPANRFVTADFPTNAIESQALSSPAIVNQSLCADLLIRRANLERESSIKIPLESALSLDYTRDPVDRK